MSVVRRLAAVAVVPQVLLGVVLLAGCTGGDDPAPASQRAPSTPLADFATDRVSVARADLCDRVAPESLVEALGAEPERAESWANGDRAELADGVRDVAHEYGCAWVADGVLARAWVFAPPVTRAQAATLARTAGRADGCRAVTGAPAYGAPSAAVSCRIDGAGRTTFHGLFGDAWLSCSLQEPGKAPDLDRTGRWCVAVARAAGS